MVKRRGFLIACGLLALGVSACSKSNVKTYPVTGSVLLGTKPVAHATVIFHPVGDASPDVVKPSAKTNPDGSFSLTTYLGNDGAPAGEYQVTVVQQLASPNPDEPPSNRLHPKFANPATSGITATIGTGPNELKPFQVQP